MTHNALLDQDTMSQDNDLSLVQNQAIIGTNLGFLFIGTFVKNFPWNLKQTQIFLFKKTFFFKLAGSLFSSEDVDHGASMETPLKYKYICSYRFWQLAFIVLC